jgi:hypothetical protein
MNRRSIVTAAVAGGLAAVGGVAWQLRATRLREEERAAVDRDTAGFWGLSFPTPDEPEPRSIVTASFRGQPLLVNFWGTWCPPCVKEMPELDRFSREHAAQGWRAGWATRSPACHLPWPSTAAAASPAPRPARRTPPSWPAGRARCADPRFAPNCSQFPHNSVKWRSSAARSRPLP